MKILSSLSTAAPVGIISVLLWAEPQWTTLILLFPISFLMFFILVDLCKYKNGIDFNISMSYETMRDIESDLHGYVEEP